MNEMRKLMETVADLDFSSTEQEKNARKAEYAEKRRNTWHVYHRDAYSEAHLFSGSYEEVVKYAKDWIVDLLDIHTEEAVIKKIEKDSGGIDYQIITTVGKAGGGDPENFTISIEPTA
jgi:hypothetical protein